MRSRFWVEKAGRDVHRCVDCGCIWVPAGLMTNERGESIYEEEEPIFLKDGNEQYYLDETNTLSCRAKVEWVGRYLPRGKRILDVGANFGHFLAEARQRWDATGIEISRAAVDKSRELFNVKNYVGSVYEPPAEAAGPWDAISFFDVVEHVPDPKSALKSIRELLAPRGRLFLTTPDAGSVVARAMGPRWHYLDPVQHIVLFGRKNLTRLLEDVGFRVIGIRTFGHHYRVGYVLDRLTYLHHGVVGRALQPLLVGARPLERRAVYINLRDVMGVVAERV